MRRSAADIHDKIHYHTVSVKQGTGSRGDREFEIQFADMQLIGNGHFASVFKATLCENGEMVAIKKINVDYRFKNRELSIMHEIDHPNVTRLLYYFYSHQETQTLNLIMEFLPKDLSLIIRQCAHNNQHILTSVIKIYVFQMLRGLGFLHLNKIMHRDINPTNLLVDESRQILKICDFGSAKKIEENDQNIAYVCSRYYRAPELLFGSQSYTTSIGLLKRHDLTIVGTDLWSCGAVVGELYNNKPLFLAESAMDVLVLQIRTLGTPTTEEMSFWNYRYAHIPMEKIQGDGIRKLIKRKLSLSTMELLDGLMKMNAHQRIKPYDALALPFFDEIRNTVGKSSSSHQIPPLFDWLEKEFIENEKIITNIFPHCVKEQS